MALFKYDGVLAAATSIAASAQYSTPLIETLVGGAGSDSLWGGDGDTLLGGAGDDTYTLAGLNVRISELAGQGIDKVVSWSNLYLDNYANIENLQVGGDGRYGAGNASDNIVEGDSGRQQLYGGGGQDVLVGGGGADTFLVIKGQGNDVIQDFSGDDVVRLTAGYTSFAQVQSHLSQVGADVKLDLGGSDGLMFRNATVGQFTAANFQLQLDTSKLGALTFADEFSAPLSLWDRESNPTGTWKPDYGFGGSQGVGSYTLQSNGEKQIYTSPYFRDHPGDFAENPFVSNADGTLSIWAKPSSNPEIFGYNYISGAITTAPTFAQTYGYFEMRAQLPNAAGAWPAFWLVPADGSWPPELDVMETLTADPRAAHTTEHSGVGGSHTQQGQESFIPDTAGGFHTYGTLWTAQDLVWYIDGVEVFHTATPADMNKPMYMLANLALGGWGGDINPAQMPAEFKIDYIRAYGVAGSTTTATSQLVAAPAAPSLAAPVAAPAPAATGAGLVLTSTGYGDTLVGSAGDDVVNIGRGPDTVTGGAGADRFVVKDTPWNAGHITDFQVGVDKLDLSMSYTGSNLAADLSFVSDGAGGSKVMLDIDGPGGAWPYQMVILDGVAPSALNASILAGAATAAPIQAPASAAVAAPASAGVTLTSTGYGDTLVGGAGNDTFNVGRGPDSLTGGGGSDTFVIQDLPWNAAHITDFQLGTDKLDISAISLGGALATDAVAAGYLSFLSDGAGGTRVMLDIDGPAAANPWPYQIVVLDGIDPGSLNAATLLSAASMVAGAPRSLFMDWSSL